MIRYKGSRRTCWTEGCGGPWVIVSFERNTKPASGIQGKFRCSKCGADAIVYTVNCEEAPGDLVEDPPLGLWILDKGPIFPVHTLRVSEIAKWPPDSTDAEIVTWKCAECGATAESTYGVPLEGWLVADVEDGPDDVLFCPAHGQEERDRQAAKDEDQRIAWDVETARIASLGQLPNWGASSLPNPALTVRADYTQVARNIKITINFAQSPIKRWVGSKAQLLNSILPLVPPKFETYYEPFLGGGAVAFALLGLRRDGVMSFERAILSDTNQRLIRAYKGIRDDVESVIAGLHETKALYDAAPVETYENARAMTYVDASRAFCPLDARDDVTMAVWFLFVNAVCFNGVYRENQSGEFNVPLGKLGKGPSSRPLPFTFDETRLRDASALLRAPGVELRACGWDDGITVEKYGGDITVWTNGSVEVGSGHDEVVYIDSPYAALSDTANFGETNGGYGGTAFTRRDQEALAIQAGVARECGATVIASNADVEWLRDLYVAEGFTLEEVDRKGTISSKGTGRGRVAEMLAYANTNRLIPGETEEERRARWAPRPIRDADMALAVAEINRPEVQEALVKARAADAATAEQPSMQRKTRMAKKKYAALVTDPMRTPQPTITRITSNVKSDRMDQPWTVDVSGSKILVVGENASGKSRVLNAIELALSGRGTDVVLRDPALPAELLNLAPPGAGGLAAEVEFSDDNKATFYMPITVVKGERKASRPTLGGIGSSATPAMLLPMRALEEAITGSADKARAFFLTAIENQTTDSDVIALLPALWHEMWTRSTTGTRAGLSSPAKVLALIESAREQQRKHRDDAKMNAMLVEQLGERMAGGMPTESNVQAANAAVSAIDTELAELADLERFFTVSEARQQLAQARGLLAGIPAPNMQAQKNHEVLAALHTVLQTAHENGMTGCPVCNAHVTPETFLNAAAALDALFRQQSEKNAEDDRNAQMRSNIEGDIRRLIPKAAEGIEIQATTRASLLDAASWPARRTELFGLRASAVANLQQLQLLRARWNDVIKARDNVALAEREHAVWAQFEKALVEARDMLIKRAVMSFENRVSLFLPENDRFGLRLNDDTGREVFQLGLWRGDDSPVFHAALAGGELTRVLCAVASVLSEGQQAPAVIIPREREHSKKTLTRTLKALADAPGTIVLTHVENLGERATKGWCVIDVDELASNGAGEARHEELQDDVVQPETPLQPGLLGGSLGGSLLGRNLVSGDGEH